MLSIAKINGADGRTGRYYTASVASGIEDYYAGKGEANGRWIGSGVGLFALDGEIDHEQFHHMLNGIDPRTGRPIRVAQRDSQTGELAEGVVRGFDLTFSAPKSVSVLYAAGEDHLAREVRAAVDHATEEALLWLERRACVIRRGAGGAAELPGQGFVGAAFRHRTSRAGDPQLHTHVVISNMARGEDGRWSALDAKYIYAHSRTAGFVFQAVMRDELTRRLGVSWRESPTPGVYEIDGVPFELMRELSKRRVEIEQALAEVGMTGATAAQVATLATRPAKDHTLDQAPGIHDGWRAICGEHGFGDAEIAAIVDRGLDRWLADEDTIQLATREVLSARGLTEKESVFSNQMVVRAWAQAAVDGATVAQLDELTVQLLNEPEIVELPEVGTLESEGVPELDSTAGRAGEIQLRLVDDALVHGGREGERQGLVRSASDVFRGRHRYTTRELLAVESDLLAHAQAGTGAGAGVCWSTTVERVLAAAPTASVEQQEMVRALALRGDRVAVVRAPAGAGKTWTLNLARQAWQHDGLTVLGVALSRRAASELGEQAQLDYATSIAKLLIDVENHRGLPQRAVLVVDEAAMVDTRTTHQLLQLVEQAHGKLVLVGDERQLPEIQAGGAFRSLAARLETIELSDNFRQQDPLERDRVLALRHGAFDAYVSTGMRTGRVVLGADAQQTRLLLLHDWLRDHRISEPGEAVMIARTNADVRWLNDAARELLKRDGDLDGPELTVADRSFQVGDLVIARRNLPRGLIDNGTRGQVIALDHARQQLTVRLHSDDREVVLGGDYLTDRHLHHAYALTTNLSQGMGVDRTRRLGPERMPAREQEYSAVTRHRISDVVYLTAPDSMRFNLPQERDPLEDIRRTIGRSAAKQLALETTVESTVKEPPPNLDELRARRDTLRSLLHTYPQRADEQRTFHTNELAAAEHHLTRAQTRATQLTDQLPGARRRDQPAIEAAVSREQRAIDAWRHERDHHHDALDRIPDQLDPDRWLATNTPAIRELAAVETILNRTDDVEIRTKLSIALTDPELRNHLGDRPLDPDTGQTWDRALAAIVTYRHHHPPSPEQPSLLGPEPDQPEHQALWQQARRALETHERTLHHDGHQIER